MPTSTLTSKGQITLPLAVRKALALDAGDQVDFVEAEGGFKVIALKKSVRTLRGRFAGRVSKPVTVEQMNEAIGRGAVARAAAKKSKAKP
ncbi:MAG: AbrB/MazE/SpoVT family DNA-binding domain-containing protein [Burkholderiaceae bacterium]